MKTHAPYSIENVRCLLIWAAICSVAFGIVLFAYWPNCLFAQKQSAQQKLTVKHFPPISCIPGKGLIEGKSTLIPELGIPLPALNVPFVDDAYRSSIRRISEPAGKSSSYIRHYYSRKSAFNSNETKLIMKGNGGRWYLYDITEAGQVTYQSALPSPMDEVVWSASNPNEYFFVPRNGGYVLNKYNVQTEETTIVADFKGRLPWSSANHIWTRWEGRPSRDGNNWCFMAEDSNFQTVGIFSYALDKDIILGTLDMSEDPDHISTSISGKYCVPSSDGSMGTRAYTTDFSSFTQLHHTSSHSDTAIDKQGNDVLVVADSLDGWLKMVSMDTGKRTNLFYKRAQNGTFAMHISGLAWNKPGYVVVSTYAARVHDENNQWHDAQYGELWGHDKLFVVELAENPRVYNIAYMHNNHVGYRNEPQATVNKDLTRIIFASNWESSEENDVRSYMVTLPDHAFCKE